MSSMILSLFFLVFIGLFANEALTPQSPLQKMLEGDQDLRTKEVPVVIQGVRYHKIEAEGKYYYFRALERKEDIPIYMCDLPQGHTSEQLLEAALKVGKRKRLFFQGLVEKCTTRNLETGYRTNAKMSWIEMENPMVGFYLGDDTNDKIKNKKLGIPIKQLDPKNGTVTPTIFGDF